MLHANSEVSIAPARRLGANKFSSLNDVGHLPLTNEVAYVTPNFNDDIISTEYITPTIADAKKRNRNYHEQVLTYNKRSLVGKKSGRTTTTQHDLGMMRKFNMKHAKLSSEQEFKDEKIRKYNLVALPFTQAEPTKFDETLC